VPDAQDCFVDGCDATFAAPILQTTGGRCPECGEWSIECPACTVIVSMDAMFDDGQCPYCDAGMDELAEAFENNDAGEWTEAVA
jgi:hypothetical protein